MSRPLLNSPKYIPRAELAALGRRLRQAGMQIVFTNGCFDLLHVGHLRYLQAARNLGDVLIVGVNSDESVRELKGSARPIVREEDRMELLTGLECVDYVTPFPELLPHAAIETLRPHVHAKGGDYRAEELPEADLVRSYGGEVVILPLVPGRSTTELERRLNGESGP